MHTIQHYSRMDVAAGLIRAGLIRFVDTKNAVLIQIKTPEDLFVRPQQEFHSIHKFQFHDSDNKYLGFRTISEDEAKRIAEILISAYTEGLDVVVHCDAGISRSSAVAVAGESIGFKLVGNKYKNPNKLVLSMIRKELETEYDPTRSAFIDGE